MAGLGPVNIFYGENNTGKSNILAALEMLFKVEKVEELESPVAGFLRGELSDFIDNFTLKAGNEQASVIQMNVRLGLSDDDLQRIPTFSSFIREHNIYEDGHVQRLELEVEITRTTRKKAVRTTRMASINRKAMYDASKSDLDRFFPSLSQKVPEVMTRQRPVEELFLYLINSFGLIHAERFLQPELVAERPVPKPVAQQFKNWLLSLSQSRGEDYRVFQRIKEWFDSTTFHYGSIRSIREDGGVGLTVEDGSKRELVIERLGTGVQQILMLLSNISCSKARILGIEEIELNLSPSLQNRTVSMLRELIAKSDERLVDQFLLTSHSMHLGRREDAVLYAVSIDETGDTKVERGPAAIRKLKEHFDYGMFRIPRRSLWRT
jgi:hypothetical protein